MGSKAIEKKEPTAVCAGDLAVCVVGSGEQYDGYAAGCIPQDYADERYGDQLYPDGVLWGLFLPCFAGGAVHQEA